MNHILRVIWPPDPDLRIVKKESGWVIKGKSREGTTKTFKSKKKAKRHLKRLASSKPTKSVTHDEKRG